MKKKLLMLASILMLSAGPAASQADGIIFTLYRNSVVDASMRIHVATFDAKETESYNQENCQLAASLFGGQPGVKAQFFCEKGRFRP